jgi:tetratricopeptide (TPR) repeat protein
MSQKGGLLGSRICAALERVGSANGLGTYVVLLQAVNCQTGETIVNEEAEAESHEKILRVLDEASTKLRSRLGESLATIQKYDTPAEATTASLDALQAYSLGMEEAEKESVPFFRRSIELDPNFAMAYARLGNAYMNSYQPTLGAAAISKAYELRERTSTREKLYIESHYYHMVTGEADKSIEVYKLWRKTYPRDIDSYINLGAIYADLGQHEKGLREETEAFQLNSHNGLICSNLAATYMNLNQFDQADEILKDANARKLESPLFQGLRYLMAFSRGDHAEMERQFAASVGEPGVEGWLLALQSDTEAYHGRLANAREYTRRAIAFAHNESDDETALDYAVAGALREAEFGNLQLAKAQAGAKITHGSGQQVLFLGALALARSGAYQKALVLVRELNQRYPKDTLLNEYWLPSIRAAVELDRGTPNQAIEYLEPIRRYELAAPALPSNVLPYPIYLRGEAYLAAGLPEKAQAEFQKILDHPGLVGNYILGALAHLGIGRAYALEAGIPVMSIAGKPGAEQHLSRALERPESLAKAHFAYQDFFGLWRDADADVPILKQAQWEYRKLQ